MENKAILFLSHLIPSETYDEVNRNSKNNMQDAANALQWHLVEGFNHNLNCKYDIINFMPIASFPQYYRKMFIRGGLFSAGTESQAYNIGFCNIKYLRRYGIAMSLYKRVNIWCKQNKNKNKVIILYTLNSIALGVLSQLKKKYSNLTICAIVADLPNMMNLSSKKSITSKFAQKITAKASYSNIDVVDKFVFLTKHMSDYLGNKKPYCVMEGIATDHYKESHTIKDERDSGFKTVLYTGTLHKKFGVMHLVEAFGLIPNTNYRLVICGAGDSEDQIREAAKKDARIIFKGQCSRAEVLGYQQSATVLVNPRMNNEEFTKYSFPSKNMEYLSSGTPLIAYKLDGIPDEYDEYINYPADSTLQALSNELVRVCEMRDDFRKDIGNKAKRFVLDEKNTNVQTKKIIKLF